LTGSPNHNRHLSDGCDGRKYGAGNGRSVSFREACVTPCRPSC
jgi:hypothetical protein